ncbi:hypothetical protein ACYT69_13310, partial [Streptococcus pyogenes]
AQQAGIAIVQNFLVSVRSLCYASCFLAHRWLSPSGFAACALSLVGYHKQTQAQSRKRLKTFHDLRLMLL